jgi:hypothetical protein
MTEGIPSETFARALTKRETLRLPERQHTGRGGFHRADSRLNEGELIMAEISREVIIDLLPAYFSGEASEQSRKLVEDYFASNPDFESMSRKMSDKTGETSSADREIEALRLKQQQRLISLFLIVGAIVAAVALIGLFWF